MKKSFLLASSALVFSLMVAAPFTAQAQENGYPAHAYGNAATGLETRLSAVEDQLRALTGKVEQMDFISRKLEQALQRLQGDYDARLNKLESSPPPQQTAQVSVPQQSAPSPAAAQHQAAANGAEEEEEAPAVDQPAVTGTLGGMKVRGDKVTGGVINPQAPALPQKPADYGLTPQEHYDLAFGLLRQANYDEAEKTFKKFIDKNGEDKLIDNAKYWYAETFYVRAKFGDAAIAFADAYQQNPKGTKAPDALLKLAMSLAAMEKTDDACGALTALKSKYKNAPATIKSRADQERSRLNCK